MKMYETKTDTVLSGLTYVLLAAVAMMLILL